MIHRKLINHRRRMNIDRPALLFGFTACVIFGLNRKINASVDELTGRRPRNRVRVVVDYRAGGKGPRVGTVTNRYPTVVRCFVGIQVTMPNGSYPWWR